MKSVFKVSLAALTLAFAVSSQAAEKQLIVATCYEGNHLILPGR